MERGGGVKVRFLFVKSVCVCLFFCLSVSIPCSRIGTKNKVYSVPTSTPPGNHVQIIDISFQRQICQISGIFGIYCKRNILFRATKYPEIKKIPLVDFFSGYFVLFRENNKKKQKFSKKAFTKNKVYSFLIEHHKGIKLK